MTRLEQIEFENKEKFMIAIDKILSSEDVFRTYKKNGEDKKIKIISKNRLYVGNNFNISIKQADNKKIYLSIDYFSVDDRFNIAKNKNNEL